MKSRQINKSAKDTFLSLIKFCILLALFLTPMDLRAETLEGDGHLVIYSYHLDELLDVTYKTNGVYNQAPLEKIYHVMRSPDGALNHMVQGGVPNHTVRDGAEHDIDIRLIELIDNIQDHFKADCIELISGYRSPEYNKKLKEEGRRVARESLHLKGLAADIHLDEITEEALRDYVRGAKVGGVGFYPDFNFVHVDLGHVKYWEGEKSSERKLIGMEHNKSSTKIVTDKNIYFSPYLIEIRATNDTSKSIPEPREVAVEKFHRGKWENFSSATTRKKGEGLFSITAKKPLVPGRYRLRFVEALSNEFYTKITSFLIDSQTP